jgi:hypothetical protein
MIRKLTSVKTIFSQTTAKSNTKTAKSSTDSAISPILKAPTLIRSRTIAAKSQTMESFRKLPVSYQFLLIALSNYREPIPKDWIFKHIDYRSEKDINHLEVTDGKDHLTGSNFDISLNSLVEQGFITETTNSLVEQGFTTETTPTYYEVTPMVKTIIEDSGITMAQIFRY